MRHLAIDTDKLFPASTSHVVHIDDPVVNVDVAFFHGPDGVIEHQF